MVQNNGPKQWSKKMVQKRVHKLGPKIWWTNFPKTVFEKLEARKVFEFWTKFFEQKILDQNF